MSIMLSTLAAITPTPVKAKKQRAMSVGKTPDIILKVFKRGGGWTNARLSKETGIGRSTVNSTTLRLKARGLIKEKCTQKSASPVDEIVYILNEDHPLNKE